VNAIDVASVPTDDGDLAELLTAYFKDICTRYWEFEITRESFDAEIKPGVRFLLARRDGTPVGCCALQRNPESGLEGVELKRMYVDPAARGTGVANALLEAAEKLARGLGAPQIYLETGTRQPEARRVYERNGYTEIPKYPPWVDMELSVTYAKRLG
jgi:GNAT superfamily N-acetyltransferase